jgi:Tfp pilus assembly protein PilN
MAFINSSLGIDFRANHLILTLLRKSFGKIRLVDFRIHSVPPESQKDAQQNQWIGLITPFLAQHSIDKERVSIAIPREKVIIRFLRLPAAAQENLRQVLEYEATKYVPFDAKEICFDYRLVGQGKEFLDVIVLFAKREEINFYLSLMKKMGIQPLSIQIPSVAALNLFLYNRGEKEDPFSVLLDVTEPSYEMNLVYRGEWKESFLLPLSSDPGKERILNSLQRGGMQGDWISQSTFFPYGIETGGKGLPLWEKDLPPERVSFPPLDRIDCREERSKIRAIYASTGIALKGLIPTPMDLNLLPLDLRKRVKEIGKFLFPIFLVLALILSLTWGWGVFRRHQDELTILREEVRKRKPEVEIVENLRRQREELLREISDLEKIRADEVSKVEILKELTQILPPTVWIWNFKITGKEIEISGFADSASDLIPRLDRSPLFERVEFLAPVTKEREKRTGEEKEKERFKIKMRLEGRRAGP